ncbi:MAG: 50S ribosomal protein L18 [Clostridiales bacterium]|jgi:large subunit ribosomal protein L18|nr:50S ribosomal protein L18 [Clostridiales bacterium]
MIIKENKNEIRKNRHYRVRAKVSGTAARPRLNVYRSTAHIYAQLIDDEKGVTLVSSSTIAKGVDVKGRTKTQAAEIVGRDLAAKALKAGFKDVVFDRGGYLYTGRVKTLADAARDGGLAF